MEIKTIEKHSESLLKEVNTLANKDISLNELAELRNSYIGKTSKLGELFKEVVSLPKEDRSRAGTILNQLKTNIELFFEQYESQLIEHQAMEEDSLRDIDLTAPKHVNQQVVPSLNGVGNLNPISEEINNILDVFRTMGFSVFEARELDTEYYIFDSLGFPKNHPARENWDAFKTEEGYVPSPHTSNMQVRIMRLLKKAPMRAVIYGRCFRNEAVDAVHGHTFYQVEGVYVDKDISVSNMIATIKAYLEGFFEQDVVWKIQPAFFPFVEPGIEFMVRCIFCGGVGCQSCKYAGWLEMAGAGMIHPFVLKEGGIDPQKYTGFAWGLGLDRTIMQKNGIKDIRSLFGSDIRFLRKTA